MFQIYQEKFNLKFKIGSPRVGEKIHEILASREEIQRLSNSECGTFFILKPTFSNNLTYFNVLIKGEDYSSKECTVSKKELQKILDKFNYFRPL